MKRTLIAIAASLLLAPAGVPAQTAPPQVPVARDGAPDPLAIGRKAMERNDYASAKAFFTQYVQENPTSSEARFQLASAELGLRNYAVAVKGFSDVLSADPGNWGAHSNLVIAYAGQEHWKEFDAERELIATARRKGTPGLSTKGNDVIDVFYVNDSRYIVRQSDPPSDRFYTKYRFTTFDKEGKLTGWIACESDDIDQTFFAKAHPKEAAEGKRSYSLDSYSPVTTLANGQRTQTHGTMKFYADGEPTYQTVRTDVIAAAKGNHAPLSSTTSQEKPK